MKSIKMVIAVALLTLANKVVMPKPAANSSEVDCMAAAVYYESRGEPARTKRAVLDVVMSRTGGVKSVCDVIAEPHQFSWYKKYKLKSSTQKLEQFQLAVSHRRVLDSRYKFFYSGRKPEWAYNMHCTKINAMQFCRKMKDV